MTTDVVLVIDDEPQIRRVVRHALEGDVRRVVEAATGREGIDAAAAERPALVVLDLGLPDMPGLDVCREIRQWSEAPIVVLSAGSYTVARDNLGRMPGLVAAAALHTDYILTVAVSISAGVAAITSAYPSLGPHRVLLGVVAIMLLMTVNLRGVRESGIAFSVPTHLFIVLMLVLIGTGLYRGLTGHEVAAPLLSTPAEPTALPQIPLGFAFTFLILRAFAEGCVAMTGTEAISNGVGAFKEPRARNAAATLTWMALILATFFLGTSYLAQHYQVMPAEHETVLSQLGHHIFGSGWLYFTLQYATFALLVLAANTAFADFPRLSSIMARDGYMPRQFAARGDRLAFSNGIIALAVVAALLVWVFAGDTNALIPLYAIGVFICFTLSQAGMVARWW